MADEQDPVAWLRAQVEGDLALARSAISKGDGSWRVQHAYCDEDCPDPCPRAGRCHIDDGHGEGTCWCVVVDGADICIYDEGGHDQAQAEHIARHDPRGRIADCEAKLAIIGRCEALAEPEGEALWDWLAEREDDEAKRDRALADFADDILALLADGYRHRPGWAGHWACPGCGKALHEVPDGHATGISMQDGTWSCGDPAKPAAMSPEEFLDGIPRLHPGARVTVNVAYGDDRFGTMPPPAGDGFTVAEGGWTTAGPEGPVWRGVVASVTDNTQARQYSIELEIEGRYPAS